MVKGFVAGLVGVWALLWVVPTAPSVSAAPRASVPSFAAQALGSVDPAQPLRFDLIPTAAQLALGPYSLADITASTVLVYVDANADKVIANVNDASAVAATVGALTCGVTAGGWTCTTGQTKGQIVGSTTGGVAHRVAIVSKLKKADGTLAAPAVSQLCTFQFPIIDNRTSLTPTNLR